MIKLSTLRHAFVATVLIVASAGLAGCGGDEIHVQGRELGYTDRMSATINVDYGEHTVEKYAGKTSSIKCFGDPGETNPIVSLEGVVIKKAYQRYAITEGVGSQLSWGGRCDITFPDGTTRTDEVMGSGWASPNQRYCRSHKLPCATN